MTRTPQATAKLSNGSLAKMLAAISAAVAALGAIHAYFVVPGILRTVALERRQVMEALVPRREFEMHLKEAERTQDQVMRTLLRIEDKLK